MSLFSSWIGLKECFPFFKGFSSKPPLQKIMYFESSSVSIFLVDYSRIFYRICIFFTLQITLREAKSADVMQKNNFFFAFIREFLMSSLRFLSRFPYTHYIVVNLIRVYVRRGRGGGSHIFHTRERHC